MALQVWIPGTDGTLKNQGLYPLPNPSYNNIVSTNNGKLGKDIKNFAIYHLNSDFIISSWSICTWVKFSSTWSEWNNIIFSKNTSDSEDSQIYLSIVNNTTLNIGRGASGGFTYQLSNGFQPGVWYHIAATYDGTNVTLYLNGSKVAGGSSIGSYKSALNLCIGCRSTNEAGTNITGWGPEQNDIRLYDHCLSPKEVKEISKGLVLHYPLNDAYVQNTTNLNKSIGTSWGHWGTNTITSNSFISPEGTLGSHVNCSSFTDGGVSVSHSSFSVKPDTTYVISAKMKLTGYTNKNLFYWREYNSSKTQLSESGKWSSTNALEYGHGYKLYYGIVTTSSETSSVQLQSYFYGVGEHWIYDIQVEEGQYPTPFAGYNTSRIATTVYDCSGYQNNGTISGALSCSTDSPRYNKSCKFGSGIIGTTSGFASAQSYTFWANVVDKTAQTVFVDGASKLGFGMFSTYFICSSAGKTSAKYSTANLTIGWHHFAVVNDLLYIDGVLQEKPSGTDTWVYSGSMLEIGNRSNGNSYPWKGQISDFRVYATALSEEDIKELYNTSCIINS